MKKMTKTIKSITLWLALSLLGGAQNLVGLSCEDIQIFEKKGVTKQALLDLKRYIDMHGMNQQKKSDVISLADYSISSVKKRFWILNLKKKTVQAYKVSHGSGKLGGVAYGDLEHDGMLNQCRFSSERLLKFNARKHRKHTQQNMTRPGFFRSGALYNSPSHREKRKNGRLVKGWPNIRGSLNAMRLKGLSPGVNDKAMAQGVVMHGAWYNQAKIMGRSYGCPAFTPSEAPEILQTLTDEKALFYSYVPQCKAYYANALKGLPASKCKD